MTQNVARVCRCMLLIVSRKTPIALFLFATLLFGRIFPESMTFTTRLAMTNLCKNYSHQTMPN